MTALYRAGRRHVTIHVPGHREARGTLTELDAWGGARITGTGRPPFLLPEERTPVLADETGRA